MKIGTLNTWSGCCGDALLRFVYETAAELDIFCLQEVHYARDSAVPRLVSPEDAGHRLGPINLRLFNELLGPLSYDFDCFYAPAAKALHDCEPTAHNILFGNAIFVRKSVDVHTYWSGIVSGYRDKLFCEETDTAAARSGQILTFQHDENVVVLGHTHGIWFRGDKGDVPCRQKQMGKLLTFMECERQRIRDQFSEIKPAALLLGDLNLLTNTQTVRDIKQANVFGYSGCVHLTEHTDTRTVFYPKKKPYREADHVFASGCLNAQTRVISENVPSDHALLITTI